jgi:hypothetical protein
VGRQIDLAKEAVGGCYVIDNAGPLQLLGQMILQGAEQPF